MATSMNSAKSLIRANARKVNGCAAFGPDFDDAIELMHQAHAVMALVGSALDEKAVNEDLIRAALRGGETLLETAIRFTSESYSDLCKQLPRH